MTDAEKQKLYEDYRGRVLGYIRARVSVPEDAEDLCEDVFEKAFRAADSYDASKASPGTWIYSITRNTVIDFYRRSRPTDEIPEDLSDDNSPEASVIDAETLEELAKALEKLPRELADLIVYHYYDRMPLTEIASRLGQSYGAVKLRHQKALALLRAGLR